MSVSIFGQDVSPLLALSLSLVWASLTDSCCTRLQATQERAENVSLLLSPYSPTSLLHLQLERHGSPWASFQHAPLYEGQRLQRREGGYGQDWTNMIQLLGEALVQGRGEIGTAYVESRRRVVVWRRAVL